MRELAKIVWLKTTRSILGAAPSSTTNKITTGDKPEKLCVTMVCRVCVASFIAHIAPSINILYFDLVVLLLASAISQCC